MRLCLRLLEVIIHYPRKSADHKAQINISLMSGTNALRGWFVLCDLQIFSGSVYHPKQPRGQYFSISQVFLFLFWWEEERCSRSFNHVSLVPNQSLVAPFRKTQNEERDLFGSGKYDLIASFSATMVTTWGRRNEECDFWARAAMVAFWYRGATTWSASFGLGKLTPISAIYCCCYPSPLHQRVTSI